MNELTIEQKRKFYRDGFIVLKQAVPEDMVIAARRALFERIGRLQRVAGKALATGDASVLSQALRDIGGSHEDVIMNLLRGTSVQPMLESALGAPLAPVTGAQIATLFPGQDDDKVNEAGYRNRDTPWYGWVGHLDGLWNGATPPPPVDRPLTAEEEQRWQGERGTNSVLKYHPEHNTNIMNFAALVGICLSDQRNEGVGNLGLLKGGHRKMEAFFRWQRDQGGPLGPEGPGWPRVDESAPNKHGLVHYPERVRRAYKRGAAISEDGRYWPKPTFIKVRPGDAVIVHHATPHSGSRVMASDPRMMVYYRTAPATRTAANGSVYPEALCDIWHEWPGMREVVG